MAEVKITISDIGGPLAEEVVEETDEGTSIAKAGLIALDVEWGEMGKEPTTAQVLAMMILKHMEDLPLGKGSSLKKVAEGNDADIFRNVQGDWNEAG